MTAENRSDNDKKGHSKKKNLKTGIDFQYRIRNNSAYDLKQKEVFEEYWKNILREKYGILNLKQINIRSTDMSQDFYYNGEVTINVDTVESYFRGQPSTQCKVGLIKYKTNVLEVNFTDVHKYFLWMDSLRTRNFSVIFPNLLLKPDGECTEEEYKNF